MLHVLDIAHYFYQKFYSVYGEEIDEMKLHKLIYFFVRECYVQQCIELTNFSLEARQYGPVSSIVREAYKHHTFSSRVPVSDLTTVIPILDAVFDKYAAKSSWSLSSITHGEESWIKARERHLKYKDATIRHADIMTDAARIRLRRFILNGHHA